MKVMDSVRGDSVAKPDRLWLFFVVFGLVLFVGGGLALADSLRYVAVADRADGVVVKVVERSSGDFSPVVRFSTDSGQVVEFTADETAGEKSHFRVGQSIRVLYEPAHPQNAQLDTWVSRWGYEGTAIGLGLFIAACGVGIRAQQRARRRLRNAVIGDLAEGEEVRRAGLGSRGPSWSFLWLPLALAVLLLLSADWLGDWLGWLALAVGVMALVAIPILWRGVRVILTDRRLLVVHGRARSGGAVLDVPRDRVRVHGLRQGVLVWGAVEFMVDCDEPGNRPIRLSFTGVVSLPVGRAIYAELASHMASHDVG